MSGREVAGGLLRLVRHIEWFEAFVGSATICLVARWAAWPVSLFVAVTVVWFIVRAAIDRMFIHTQHLFIDELMKAVLARVLSDSDGDD